MTPDPSVLAEIAARHSIPPAMLWAVGQQESAYADDVIAGRRRGSSGEVGAFQFMPATLQAYGFSASEMADDFYLQAELAARKLSADYERYGTWERTLSAYNSGNPDAYTSPTSPVGGYVYSVLGHAGSNPTYGMGGGGAAATAFKPADFGAYGTRSADLQQHLQDMHDQGGIVNAATLSAYHAQNSAVMGQAPQITGRSGDTNYGFTLQAMPFDASYLQRETEAFGDRTGPGGYAEAGNDYGLAHGTQITAPVGGKLSIVDYGHANTGLTAYIEYPDPGGAKNPDGSPQMWKIGVGHLASVSAQDGATVTAGQPIALSGGDPKLDRSPGNTTGPHIEFQLIDPQGRFRDPHPLLVAAAQGGVRAPADAAMSVQRAAAGAARSIPPAASPDEVGQFAAQLQAAGIDPGHFAQHYGYVAAARRRLLQANTDVSDYAPLAPMDRSAMMQYIRSQPHPTYPQITAGQFDDMRNHASLHSVPLHNRTPYPAEVARLAAINADWRDVREYYTAAPVTAPAPKSSGIAVPRRGQPQ
jgi:murein DD-endopeptidase MepM/ murein hydrolase activator NlpD